MKKILALILAALMLTSMVACDAGGVTNNPGTNNNDPGVSQNGENNNGGTTYEWPSKVSDIAWSGSGKIICVEEASASSMGEVEIYIDSATMAELGAYVQKLKDYGLRGGDAPASFSDGSCSWRGNEGAIKVTLYETEGPERGYVDGAYQLVIRIQTDAACFK